MSTMSSPSSAGVAATNTTQLGTSTTGKRARDAPSGSSNSSGGTAHDLGDGEALFAKMRHLDPDARREDYVHPPSSADNGWSWDVKGLADDLRLTQTYTYDALEAAVMPIRKEIKALADTTPKNTGVAQVAPEGVHPVFLTSGEIAKDAERIRKLGVRLVVNCSPQTVKTGRGYYGENVDYMDLWEDDLLDYCVLQDFGAIWHFATASDIAHADAGGDDADKGPLAAPLLLHCEQGINRSGALAVALCLRLREKEFAELSPEESLRLAWRTVVERRGKVVTNPAFQRQLVLFARLGCRWFPSLEGVWRTAKERQMARFRTFAERIAWAVVVEPQYKIDQENHWRMVVYLRDQAMRGESKMDAAYDIDTPGFMAKASRRIRTYASKTLAKKCAENASGAPRV